MLFLFQSNNIELHYRERKEPLPGQQHYYQVILDEVHFLVYLICTFDKYRLFNAFVKFAKKKAEERQDG